MSHEDDEMAKIIMANLAGNLSLPYDRLTIAVALRQVTLVGELDHAFQIEAAADSVWATPGVLGLDNLITIRTSPLRVPPADVEGSSDMDNAAPYDPAEKRHREMLAATLASGMIAAKSPASVEEGLAVYFRVLAALDR